jgi:hypothetical protein
VFGSKQTRAVATSSRSKSRAEQANEMGCILRIEIDALWNWNGSLVHHAHACFCFAFACCDRDRHKGHKGHKGGSLKSVLSVQHPTHPPNASKQSTQAKAMPSNATTPFRRSQRGPMHACMHGHTH